MNILFDEKNGIFKLDTPNTSYVMGLADQKWLGHIYWGASLPDTDLKWVLNLEQSPKTPDTLAREALSFYDCFPAEYSVSNIGDFREPCLTLRTAAGQRDCLPIYKSHRILRGKSALTGLPGTFASGNQAMTLLITLADENIGAAIELSYTVFSDQDAIVRSVRIKNTSAAPFTLERVLSSCVDLPYEEGMQYLTLHGSWARERAIQFADIAKGYQGTASKRGISSHQEHPFLAVLDAGTSQTSGRVWAMNFVYSGSFLAQVQRDQFDHLRMVMGIHPEAFSWYLAPGEEFQAPEVVCVYSGRGLGAMTRTFHDLYRGHLIRSKYQFTPRPILINNWEATYFDFDEEKLLSIAAKAAKLGVNLFVLDDGWYGTRDTDSGSLGDWNIVDTRKLPNGLHALAEKINALGMKFGLWVEPEMISEDSELYRAHPDWTISTASRFPGRGRDQLVLDLSRPEVEEYVFSSLEHVLSGADISYIKWDMNRPLTDLGSTFLPPERQGEVTHRYQLAVYRLQERLLQRFPDLLLENCCSGGGRFDPGMLYYSPQIWCSDDTDAIERLAIQESTAMLYPLSTIGAHVSACPNHTVGRTTPFETRGIVAMAGTFGYELDVTKLSSEEQQQIPEQIARYRQYQSLIQRGDYYRLASAQLGQSIDAQQITAKDGSEALIIAVGTLNRANQRRFFLRLQGLDGSACYRDCESGMLYSGSALMNIGIPIDPASTDFTAMCIHLLREMP